MTQPAVISFPTYQVSEVAGNGYVMLLSLQPTSLVFTSLDTKSQEIQVGATARRSHNTRRAAHILTL